VVAPDGVRIRDEDGRVVATCPGPREDGACSMASTGSLPCAGRVVQPIASHGRAGWELRVSPAPRVCPLQAGRVWAKQPGRRWGPAGTTA
jgi:hypothetical protein